ncbi:MAG: tetratricopeptide repeat protein [Acidobacteria bacterium]|jgi:tetratricopeptide (TPR) repeat protein|nr:tetratricopeptide repeat protein [Acidobacteriota bacterium]
MALLLVLAPPLAAQKNFNQSEKMTVEKFKRARMHYDKGVDCLKKGKPAKALKEAELSMEIFADYSDAYLLLAMIHFQEGKYDAGLAEIEKAKGTFGGIREFYAASYQDYINRLREQREFTANRLADAGLSLILMREAEIRLAEIDAKLRDLKPTLDLDVPAEYHFVHGNILFKLKRFAGAQELYLAALQADPRYANAYANLIGIFLMSGDKASALKYLQQAEGKGVKMNEKLKEAVLQRQ